MNQKRSILVRNGFCLFLGLWVLQAQTVLGADSQIGVLGLQVDGRSVKLSTNSTTKLPSSPTTVTFTYGIINHEGQSFDPVRIRYKLEGYDSEWRESKTTASQMRLVIGFLDHNRNELSQVDFPVKGQSPGWTGRFATSPLRHRREMVVVPPGASTIWVVISSAGGPETMGAYFVSNFSVKAIDSTNGALYEILRLDFDSARGGPNGWMRDGARPSMAKVIEFVHGSRHKGLAVVDDDARGHAQWNTLKGQGPAVKPGEHLVLEWDEMFSVASGTPGIASYQNLKPGFYRFRLDRLTTLGRPTDTEYSMGMEIPAPFWATPWFWVAAMMLAVGLVFGTWRYHGWRLLRAENAKLAQQQVLERERFRIAQDIHDDLGARVTQISLLGSAALQKPGLTAEARADFTSVTEMSRKLIGALYETVWAVSPENDHLDSLATYICQFASQMCAQADLKCRLRVPDLPHSVPVTSSLRHNLAMVVKEAIHNVIKHADATEIGIGVQFDAGVLSIDVRDNGKGFDPSIKPRGNGLSNMQRRMMSSGGRWIFESQPGAGTRIHLDIPLGDIARAINGAPRNRK